MQFVVSGEGPCAPLFCLVITVLALSTSDAAAQSVELSSLERCADLSTQSLKIQCFEAIIESSKTIGTEIGPATTENSGPTQVSPPESAVPVLPATITKPSSDDDGDSVDAPVYVTRSSTAASTEPIAVENSASDLAAAASDTEMPTPGIKQESALSESETAISDFGAEQLPDPNRDANETVTATVTEVRQGYNRALTFYMSSGQVWRQIEPRRLQYPKNEDFEVVISQGLLGEYRLRVGGTGPLVKIRRIK